MIDDNMGSSPKGQEYRDYQTITEYAQNAFINITLVTPEALTRAEQALYANSMDKSAPIADHQPSVMVPANDIEGLHN